MSTRSWKDHAAATPPPGLTSNIGENSELWPSIIAVSTITLVVMTTAIGVRIYVKAIATKDFGWEEYLAVFAVATIVTWTVIFDMCCHLGISRHQWNVESSIMPRILNYLNIVDILYGPMLGAAKFSILLQLRRHFLAKTANKSRIIWLMYSTGLTIGGYYGSCILQFAFQCIPREAIWAPTAQSRCISSPGSTFAAGAFALLTDLMLYALLVWLIVVLGSRTLGGWLGLSVIIFVSLFGIAAATASLYYRMPFIDTTDLTYHVGIVGLWAMAEYTALILVGCIPSFGLWVAHQQGTAQEEKSNKKEDM